ncbi:MAG: hypothetical protein K2Z81_24670 [Cyanobacteria bacterium]|nr:hypothetical protein [Cyanobacteriota bacterium]
MSPSPIVATVLTLLSGIPEDEWIFWCMDDHFPVRLDLNWLEEFTSDIHSDSYRGIYGVNFCASYRKKRYWRNALIRQDKFRAIGKNTFVEIPDYDQIWLPQFIRAGALRRFFIRMPEPVSGAKEMDDSMRTLSKPREDVLLLTGRDRAIFAESTYAGQYTEDFVASATKMGVGLEKGRLARGVVWKESRGKMGIADRIEKLIK